MGAGDREEAGTGSRKKRKEASASDVKEAGSGFGKKRKEASASDVLQLAGKKTAKWTIAKWRVSSVRGVRS
ncbi:hypothetical protein E2562_012181 [Oryza meyeriana var. granulata]|uniref:Uncharacterized protein n=1 Tax=Oryza meyeriana var. granulata TaxID=110450 RepID=A0A6G1F7E9_9ORYZ|nr:hypothetical protein E2562_012181 [Oryza meyeriana var. granulata]